MKNYLKRFQNTLNKERGITLVALVITIVILIILAVISITAVFGENGLIKRAEEAKNMTEEATRNEEQSIANAVAYMNEILGGSNPDKPENPREVEGVTIPEGFYYVGGTKAEGIVISDAEADLGRGTSHEVAKTLEGNQYVWIPVEEDSLFERYAGYVSGSLQSLSNYTEPYTNGYANEVSEYNEMKTSVLDHNGFYVGRYEAGTTNSGRTASSGITDEVLIKQGQNVYNYVKWGTSMTNELGGAVELSKGLAEAKGYTSVTSTLIYGVQWDAIMNFIDPAYSEGKCETSSFVRDSSGKGWYNQSKPTVTGSNADYAVKNIYDLGGNVWEWTMEADGTNFRVVRGGSCYDSASDGPASYRGSNNPFNSLGYFGFRPALYL